MANEFHHYPGCRHNDPDNCSACALTDTRQEVPIYEGWPLIYMRYNRAIPAKWRNALKAELKRSDNPTYTQHLAQTIKTYGVKFTDARPFKAE